MRQERGDEVSTSMPEDQHEAAACNGSAELLVERLFGAVLGILDVSTIHIGDRLGLYTALVSSGGATSGELAAATATDERYVGSGSSSKPSARSSTSTTPPRIHARAATQGKWIRGVSTAPSAGGPKVLRFLRRP